MKRFTDPDIRIFKLETWLSRSLSYCTFVTLVDGLLVESGFPHARGKLLAALEGARVEQVVNTHAHEDHFGNDAAVAERFGAVIRAPAASLPLLANPKLLGVSWYRRIVWGMPAPCRAEALGSEVRTPRFRFEVVPTPGHSRDHVCLFEPTKGWLFTGDLYISPRVRLARPEENTVDLIASIERLLALKPRILFCYHRGPIEDACRALEEKLQFLRQLQHKIHELRGAGLATREIARRVLGPEPLKFRLVTGGDFSQLSFVRSFLKEPGQGYDEPRSTVPLS